MHIDRDFFPLLKHDAEYEIPPTSDEVERHAFNALQLQSHAGLYISTTLAGQCGSVDSRLVFPELTSYGLNKLSFDDPLKIVPVGELAKRVNEGEEAYFLSLGHMPATEHDKTLSHLRYQAGNRTDASPFSVLLQQSMDIFWDQRGVQFDNGGIPPLGYVRTAREAYAYLSGQSETFRNSRHRSLPASALYEALFNLPKRLHIATPFVDPERANTKASVRQLESLTVQAYHNWKHTIGVYEPRAWNDWGRVKPSTLPRKGYRSLGYYMYLSDSRVQFAFTNLDDLRAIDATSFRRVVQGADRADTLFARVNNWMQPNYSGNDELRLMLWGEAELSPSEPLLTSKPIPGNRRLLR